MLRGRPELLPGTAARIRPESGQSLNNYPPKITPDPPLLTTIEEKPQTPQAITHVNTTAGRSFSLCQELRCQVIFEGFFPLSFQSLESRAITSETNNGSAQGVQDGPEEDGPPLARGERRGGLQLVYGVRSGNNDGYPLPSGERLALVCAGQGTNA